MVGVEFKIHSRQQQKCRKNGFLKHRRRMENKKTKSLKKTDKKVLKRSEERSEGES